MRSRLVVSLFWAQTGPLFEAPFIFGNHHWRPHLLRTLVSDCSCVEYEHKARRLGQRTDVLGGDDGYNACPTGNVAPAPSTTGLKAPGTHDQRRMLHGCRLVTAPPFPPIQCPSEVRRVAPGRCQHRFWAPIGLQPAPHFGPPPGDGKFFLLWRFSL